MKIARIQTYFLHPGVAKNLLLCRVETEDGHYGWGEAYVTAGKEKVVNQYLLAMAPQLIGRSVFNIRHTAQVLVDEFTTRRVSVDFLCAWSAIEIASWDIIGKKAGMPVYNLLGGAVRERIRVYANGWWHGAKSIEETVERALKVKAAGYTALKWDPMRGPWRNFISKEDEDYAVANVKAVREALGPDMDLLIDGHRRLAPFHAIRIVERLAEYNIAWYEEPSPPENLELTAEFRRSLDKAKGVPVVTGECLYTMEAFLPVIEKRAADILNPDTCAAGGISGMLDIANMARPHAIAISPHNYNSAIVGLAATVHFSAVITNFTIAECFINLIPACEEVASKGLVIKDGWVDLPTEPGLGVDIDLDRLAARPFKDIPGKPMRHYWEEFPRKMAVSASPNPERKSKP